MDWDNLFAIQAIVNTGKRPVEANSKLNTIAPPSPRVKLRLPPQTSQRPVSVSLPMA
jgi:hypothetical protein